MFKKGGGLTICYQETSSIIRILPIVRRDGLADCSRELFSMVKGDGRVWLDFGEKFKNFPKGLRYSGILTVRRISPPQKPNKATVGLSLRENGKELVEVDHSMRHPLSLGVSVELNVSIPFTEHRI